MLARFLMGFINIVNLLGEEQQDSHRTLIFLSVRALDICVAEFRRDYFCDFIDPKISKCSELNGNGSIGSSES